MSFSRMIRNYLGGVEKRSAASEKKNENKIKWSKEQLNWQLSRELIQMQKVSIVFKEKIHCNHKLMQTFLLCCHYQRCRRRGAKRAATFQV